jgi:hypothetical protein
LCKHIELAFTLLQLTVHRWESWHSYFCIVKLAAVLHGIRIVFWQFVTCSILIRVTSSVGFSEVWGAKGGGGCRAYPTSCFHWSTTGFSCKHIVFGLTFKNFSKC